MATSLKKYDQHCTLCGWVGEITVEPGTHPPCPECAGQTERIFLGGYGVIGDDIPGGQVIENLGHTPVKVYSKSEIKRLAEQRGLVQKVQHTGVPGSDKSPHTTKWT
jgi:hypothetical protein